VLPCFDNIVLSWSLWGANYKALTNLEDALIFVSWLLTAFLSIIGAQGVASVSSNLSSFFCLQVEGRRWSFKSYLVDLMTRNVALCPNWLHIFKKLLLLAMYEVWYLNRLENRLSKACIICPFMLFNSFLLPKRGGSVLLLSVRISLYSVCLLCLRMRICT